MINEFLKLRGNCVFFMDYSFYSTGGYFQLTPHFNSLTNLLTEKILKIAMPQNAVLFGFSFGARLVTKAGVLIASSDESKIDKIYGKPKNVSNNYEYELRKLILHQHVIRLVQGSILYIN